MSGQSSGSAPVMIRGKDAPKPPPSERELQRAQQRREKQQAKKSRKSNARRSLSERLPEGVYDERPVMKRYAFHWVYFWLYARLALYKTSLTVPRASKRELERRKMGRIRELSETRQPTTACLNSKGGGGKTITSTNLSVGCKASTGRETIIVDANQSKGHVLSRFGFDRAQAPVLLRGFLRYEFELSTSAQINNAFVQDPVSNVLLLGSEATKTTAFSQALFEKRMQHLSQCTHTMILDAGNGDDHPATRGSVSVADVLVFPANTQQPDSFDDLVETREAYQDLGFTNKVENGIIVLLGLSRPEALALALEKGWNPNKVVAVPKDPYMVGLKRVRWNKLRMDTRLALLNVIVKIFEATPEQAKWNENADDAQNAEGLDLEVVNEPTGSASQLNLSFTPSDVDSRVPQLVTEGR